MTSRMKQHMTRASIFHESLISRRVVLHHLHSLVGLLTGRFVLPVESCQVNSLPKPNVDAGGQLGQHKGRHELLLRRPALRGFQWVNNTSDTKEQWSACQMICVGDMIAGFALCVCAEAPDDGLCNTGMSHTNMRRRSATGQVITLRHSLRRCKLRGRHPVGARTVVMEPKIGP